MSNQKTSVSAWLLKVNQSWAAVGEQEVKLLVENPEVVEILGAPKHCNKLLAMGNNLFPMANFPGEEQITEHKFVALVSYFDAVDGKAEYGAINLDEIPVRINVTNDMTIELDEIDSNMHAISKLVFKYDSNQINVLDLDKLFNGNY